LVLRDPVVLVLRVFKASADLRVFKVPREIPVTRAKKATLAHRESKDLKVSKDFRAFLVQLVPRVRRDLRVLVPRRISMP
jgi:hypothetical protein